MKFKVGDKVRVRDDSVLFKEYKVLFSDPYMGSTIGKFGTIEVAYNYWYKIKEFPGLLFSERMLEPVTKQNMEKIVIYQEGEDTIVKYYKNGKVVVGKSDAANFKDGIMHSLVSAFNKMEEEEIGYTWVKCVGYRTKDSFSFTIDKKYKIYNNGSITDDTGFTFCSKKTKREMLDFLSQFYIFEEVDK